MSYSIARRVEQVQVRAHVVDQALPITRQVTRVEIRVIGMATHILASRRAGVDVANALVIRKEVNALAYPAWSGYIAIEL